MNNIYNHLIYKLKNNQFKKKDIIKNFNKNSSEYTMMILHSYISNKKIKLHHTSPLKQIVNDILYNCSNTENNAQKLIYSYLLNNTNIDINIKNNYEIIALTICHLLKEQNNFSWLVTILLLLFYINKNNLSILKNEYDYVYSQKRENGTYGYSDPFSLTTPQSNTLYKKNEFHIKYMNYIIKSYK